jgi:hypothetical protein
MSQVITIQTQRTCNGCTACCSGALEGEVYGHKFWKGRPCHFLEDKQCSIYTNRPEDPCQKFQCGYLALDWIPHWMRPDLSGVIFTQNKTKNGVPYYSVIEYKGKMSAEVLSFFFLAHVSGKFQNFAYQIDGGWNRFGSLEFIAEFDQK